MTAPFRVIRSLERRLEQSKVNLAELETWAATNAQKIEDERAWQAEIEQALDALHALDEEDLEPV